MIINPAQKCMDTSAQEIIHPNLCITIISIFRKKEKRFVATLSIPTNVSIQLLLILKCRSDKLQVYFSSYFNRFWEWHSKNAGLFLALIGAVSLSAIEREKTSSLSISWSSSTQL